MPYIKICQIIQDVEEIIKEDQVLKIVTDYICIEKKGVIEEVKKEKRKGEDVWIEMWERERVDNLVKKEIDEEEVCKDVLEMKMDITHNLDQMISQVPTQFILKFFFKLLFPILFFNSNCIQKLTISNYCFNYFDYYYLLEKS